MKMKHLKALGLIVLAAAALGAVAGIGTASATVLCTATETPCGEANLVKINTEIHADAAPPPKRSLFERTDGVIIESCTGSTLTSQVINKGGATETVTTGITSSSITWSGCEAGGVAVTETGSFEIHHIAGTDNGTLIGKGFGIKLLKSECTYTPGPTFDLGAVTGPSEGAPARIDIATILVKSKGGILCLPHIFWTATYEVTKPEGATPQETLRR